MPLGATLAVIGVAGGFAAGKLGGGSKDSTPAPQANSSSLVDQATKSAPPNAIQAASQASDQAQVAASKQKKKAAAGDTIMTPRGAPGASGSAVTTPATLIGSK